MSCKALAWMLLAAIALALILLFNYWASFQPLSTLLYSGIVLALCGLANLAIPFRFLGIRKRAIGAIIFVAGVSLAAAALLWPAALIHVAHSRTVLDEVMPEYQFGERHSLRAHARPEQVMQAVRQSRFADMKSLRTLLKIRTVAMRISDSGDAFQDKRVLDAFAASGYVSGGNAHEVVMCGGANALEKRPLQLGSLQECANYREPSGFKMAFNFYAEAEGDGWSTVSTETRMLALDAPTRRGMARYWRLIVPGSGLLRRQWLAAIKDKAESLPNASS